MEELELHHYVLRSKVLCLKDLCQLHPTPMMMFLTCLVLLILTAAKAYVPQVLDLKPIDHPLHLAYGLWYPQILVVWAKG